MSAHPADSDMNPALRAALEALAMVRDGRARLHSLLSVLEDQNPDLSWDLVILKDLFDGAAAKGLVYRDDGAWAITQQGRSTLQQLSTEVEERDDPDGETNDWSGAPFDPSTLHVQTHTDPVFSILERIRKGMIWLQPAFQRNFVWDTVRQSQLIESILLRIPLPAFYLDATDSYRSQVMDGLQRLSTLDAFCNKKTLKLTGLRYLKHFEQATFDALPASMQQLILHDTRLTLHTIQSETPRWVRFEVFRRVNTGGLTLTAQEIRHALYQGKATVFLRQFAEDDDFLRVTTRSISSLRMDDRECILRFLAFNLYDYGLFRQTGATGTPANLDDLLNRTMEDLNNLSDVMVEQLGDVFRDSLRKAEALFGQQAFRKLTWSQLDREAFDRHEIVWNPGRRSPISKPLFETWTVLLRPYSMEDVTKHRAVIIRAFLDRFERTDFVTAITLGTGSRTNIVTRFEAVERLLRETIT